MSSLPPGVVWLSQRLQYVLPPPLVVCLLRALSPVKPPTWLFALGLVSSFPVAFSIWVTVRDYLDYRRARALNAVLPPRLQDWTPGSLKNLRIAVGTFKIGYIADGLPEDLRTFNFRILFENKMVTSEPEYIKAILATQFDDFVKGNAFIFQMDALLGTGVFNSDGEMWKFHRAMTRPFFSKERISHFDIFDRHSEDAVSQMKERLKEGFPVDFQDVAARFTLDSATEFLFGHNVHSLSAGLLYPNTHPFAEKLNAQMREHSSNKFAFALAEAQRIVALRARYGINWPLREFWSDTTAQHMKVIGHTIDPILKEVIGEKKAAGGENFKLTGDIHREVKDGETLLDHLVNYTDDKKILKDECLNIMIASRDTTTATLTFAIYMLAENPHVLERLRKEILDKVGNSRRPTLDDMRELKYLRAVINETLRLYPPVPWNSRTTNKETLWPSKDPNGKPFYIPANTRVPYSVFAMHRRKDLWGPDAEEFDPDRFLDHRVSEYFVPNPFIFVPFNAGPRICLGQQFAYNEVSFFLIRLIQNFSSITLAEDVQRKPPEAWKSGSGRRTREKVWMRSHLTMYATDGLWVRMEEAHDV